MLEQVDVRYFAKVLVAAVDGSFDDRAFALAAALDADVPNIDSNVADHLSLNMELPGVRLEVTDNGRRGIAVTLSWAPDHEEVARDALAWALSDLGWAAWSITSFDGRPMWPELVRADAAAAGIESALQTIDNELRRLHKLRELDAPSALTSRAEAAVRDAIATARERGWDGQCGAMQPELYALLRSLG